MGKRPCAVPTGSLRCYVHLYIGGVCASCVYTVEYAMYMASGKLTRSVI